MSQRSAGLDRDARFPKEQRRCVSCRRLRRCSVSSDSAASERAKRCARAAPLRRSRSLPPRSWSSSQAARRDHARFRDRTRISRARLPAHMGALLCCGSGHPARRRPDRRRPRRIRAWQLRSRPADHFATGAAWESRRVAPHVGLRDPGLRSTTPSSIRERWMTSLLSIAHCPAGSIVLGEDVGGERGPKLVRILVGHFTAGCTFRLRRKRLSGS